MEKFISTIFFLIERMTLVLDTLESATMSPDKVDLESNIEHNFDSFLDVHRHRDFMKDLPLQAIQVARSLFYDADNGPYKALTYLEEFGEMVKAIRYKLPVDADLRFNGANQEDLLNFFRVYREKMLQVIPEFFRQRRSFYDTINAVWMIGTAEPSEEELGRLIKDRINTRKNIIGDITEQVLNGQTEIEISRHDLYSSPIQTLNWSLEEMSDGYGIGRQNRALLEALARNSISDPRNPNIKGLFLGAGTGLTELVFLAQLQDNKFKNLWHFIKSTPRDRTSFVLYDSSDSTKIGEILGKRCVTPYGKIVRRDILSGRLSELLGPEIQSKTTHYILLKNMIQNLPLEIQQAYIRQLGRLNKNFPNNDLRIIVDVPLKTHRKELQTNYIGERDIAFNEYQIREMLFIPPENYERVVIKERSTKDNLKIKIGIRIKEDYNLRNQYGETVKYEGREIVLKEGTIIILTNSMRYSNEGLKDLSIIGNLQILDHRTLGVPETAHAILYK